MQAYFDARETQSAEDRERSLFQRLPDVLAAAQARAPAIAKQLQGHDLSGLTTREALASVPVLRKSELLQIQHAARMALHTQSADAERIRVFGGVSTIGWGAARRVFASPGPIYEPESARPDYWGFARALHAAGVRAGDLVHNCFSYHFTPAGSMMETAAHALGCTVFPGGVGQTEQQVRVMADLAPQAYTGTPSFLRIILEKADEMGVGLPTLRRALFSGEAYPPSLQAWFHDRGIQGFQAYGSADLGMVAFESEARDGLILNEDIILEIVRPGTSQPVAAGEVGEVVVTTFNPDYPLVRFGTGDLSAIMPGVSACGRTNARIKGWMGRADQTTKVRGMFVHPEQIARILERHPVIHRARLVVSGEMGHDIMTLKVESGEGLDLEQVAETVRDQTKLRAVVDVVPAGSLANDGKVIEDVRSYD
ncbi:phenylacetate--CoA ligase family protein [Castellaniella sp.]|uniref:phenylacetate--CoA ligase family protein n=1 Tax=Castellaniella sp. TaxID=1955812 RepID=UPI003C7720A1